MPMDFLARIRHSDFPLVVTDANDINSAAVLVAAQLIAAEIPSLNDDPHQSGAQSPATILSITKLGRLALANVDMGRELGE